MKAKVLIEVDIDLPFEKKDAFKKYPDCIDPVGALIMDEMVKPLYLDTYKVKDVIEHD